MAFSLEAVLLDSATLCRRPALVHSAPAHIQTHATHILVSHLYLFIHHTYSLQSRGIVQATSSRGQLRVLIFLWNCALSRYFIGLSRPDVKIIGCYNNCTVIRVNLHAIATPCIMLPKQILVAQKEIERGEAHSMFFELRENSTKILLFDMIVMSGNACVGNLTA